MQRESVWDYPRPPRVEAVLNLIRIDFAGRTIAATRESKRVLETSHAPVYYIPRSSFTCEIGPGTGASFCEWKGRASYWSLRVENRTAVNCAWSYEAPASDFISIVGHLAVYPSTMDACFVDDEQVLPQPGDFYGGWITSNLTGPFKGGPGSAGW